MKLRRWIQRQQIQHYDERIRELEEELTYLRAERARYIVQAVKR